MQYQLHIVLLVPCFSQVLAVRIEGKTGSAKGEAGNIYPLGSLVLSHFENARAKRIITNRQYLAGGHTTIDCEAAEKWTDWSACSADCGGGIQTATLVERKVLHPGSGYGKDCPVLCDYSSEDVSKQLGCGERRYKICAVTLCRNDCSVVDLGNRLPSAGSPIVWKYSLAGPPGDRCFFQFWRILENSPPRLQLLGEAQPLSEVDKEVIETVAERAFNELMIHTTDEYSHLDVALGFRGCKLKSVDPEINRSAIATICLSGAEWFNRADQKVALDLDQLEFLSSAWRDSSIEWAKELALCAARKEGVGIEENVVHIGDITHSTRPQYQFSVTMSPKAPSMPTLLEPGWFELGDSIEVKVDALTRDNGVAINTIIVSVQRKFGKHLKGILEKCRFLALPECQSNSTDHPCVDTVTKRGHSIVLYNLPFASVFNVAVESENAAGRSDALRLEVATRAKPGVPYTDCAVIAWSCGEENDTIVELPDAFDPECQLTSSPSFPICKLKVRKSLFGSVKCHGKKYWRECRPISPHGREAQPSMCALPIDGKKPLKICKHDAPMRLKRKEIGSRNVTCQIPGCANLFLGFGSKHCCCQQGTEDYVEKDSDNCACESKMCASMGLVDAAEPSVQCRH